MKMISIIAITASILFGSAAFAGDTYIAVAPSAPPASATPGSYFLKNEDVKQNPMDYSDINQSPIRGKGRISVVHNEPAPGDPDADLTKAMWLLKDNGWQVSKRR